MISEKREKIRSLFRKDERKSKEVSEINQRKRKRKRERDIVRKWRTGKKERRWYEVRVRRKKKQGMLYTKVLRPNSSERARELKKKPPGKRYGRV